MISYAIYRILTMANSKPFIQAACICENVLFEKDDVASIIRIVDKFDIEIPDNLPPNVPFGFPISMFIRIKLGGLKSGTMSIQSRRPDGTQGGRQNIPIPEGDHDGAQFRTAFHVLKPQAGEYWFDVLWENELLTSVPMTVTIKQTAAPGATRQA